MTIEVEVDKNEELIYAIRGLFVMIQHNANSISRIMATIDESDTDGDRRAVLSHAENIRNLTSGARETLLSITLTLRNCNHIENDHIENDGVSL